MSRVALACVLALVPALSAAAPIWSFDVSPVDSLVGPNDEVILRYTLAVDALSPDPLVVDHDLAWGESVANFPSPTIAQHYTATSIGSVETDVLIDGLIVAPGQSHIVAMWRFLPKGLTPAGKYSMDGGTISLQVSDDVRTDAEMAWTVALPDDTIHVPEPMSLLLFALGAAIYACRRHR